MWLNEGDSNTKYFHICATNRRRRNKINFFKDEVGNWINDPLLIMSYVNNYFKDLFTSSHVITSRKNPLKPSSNVGQVDLTTLDGPLQEIEIKRAIFSFKPFKAPGPDGLHPFFYQKYWNIIGPSVVKLCKDIFDSQVIPFIISNTYLCLIPKIPNANNIRNFRPISLCNMIYKIVTKILANRLKPFLNNLISPFLASFVKNRRASDNAVII